MRNADKYSKSWVVTWIIFVFSSLALTIQFFFPDVFSDKTKLVILVFFSVFLLLSGMELLSFLCVFIRKKLFKVRYSKIDQKVK